VARRRDQSQRARRACPSPRRSSFEGRADTAVSKFGRAAFVFARSVRRARVRRAKCFARTSMVEHQPQRSTFEHGRHGAQRSCIELARDHGVHRNACGAGSLRGCVPCGVHSVQACCALIAVAVELRVPERRRAGGRPLDCALALGGFYTTGRGERGSGPLQCVATAAGARGAACRALFSEAPNHACAVFVSLPLIASRGSVQALRRRRLTTSSGSTLTTSFVVRLR
jgi:hypothetical protein